MGKRKLIIIKNATKDGLDVAIKKGNWTTGEILDALLDLMRKVLRDLVENGQSVELAVDIIIDTLEKEFKGKEQVNE